MSRFVNAFLFAYHVAYSMHLYMEAGADISGVDARKSPNSVVGSFSTLLSPTRDDESHDATSSSDRTQSEVYMGCSGLQEGVAYSSLQKSASSGEKRATLSTPKPTIVKTPTEVDSPRQGATSTETSSRRMPGPFPTTSTDVLQGATSTATPQIREHPAMQGATPTDIFVRTNLPSYLPTPTTTPSGAASEAASRDSSRGNRENSSCGNRGTSFPHLSESLNPVTPSLTNTVFGDSTGIRCNVHGSSSVADKEATHCDSSSSVQSSGHHSSQNTEALRKLSSELLQAHDSITRWGEQSFSKRTPSPVIRELHQTPGRSTDTLGGDIPGSGMDNAGISTGDYDARHYAGLSSGEEEHGDGQHPQGPGGQRRVNFTPVGSDRTPIKDEWDVCLNSEAGASTVQEFEVLSSIDGDEDERRRKVESGILSSFRAKESTQHGMDLDLFGRENTVDSRSVSPGNTAFSSPREADDGANDRKGETDTTAGTNADRTDEVTMTQLNSDGVVHERMSVSRSFLKEEHFPLSTAQKLTPAVMPYKYGVLDEGILRNMVGHMDSGGYHDSTEYVDAGLGLLLRRAQTSAIASGKPGSSRKRSTSIEGRPGIDDTGIQRTHFGEYNAWENSGLYGYYWNADTASRPGMEIGAASRQSDNDGQNSKNAELKKSNSDPDLFLLFKKLRVCDESCECKDGTEKSENEEGEKEEDIDSADPAPVEDYTENGFIVTTIGDQYGALQREGWEVLDTNGESLTIKSKGKGVSFSDVKEEINYPVSFSDAKEENSFNDTQKNKTSTKEGQTTKAKKKDPAEECCCVVS